MENLIFIRNKENTIEAAISPDYGGMVTSLKVEGKEILFLDESKLASSPVTAGGIPILFPFPGKTAGDSYEIDGETYYMPMHGIVKNRTFAVKEQEENSVKLWVREDAASFERNYPFVYKLEILYQITNESLVIKARIKNESEKELVHFIGWHPYFKAAEREALKLEHYMTVHYDYVNKVDRQAPEEIDLKQNLDDVFCMPLKNEYKLSNSKDGYSVRCIMDEPYQSIVIYNGTPGSICVEPWCGIPDSIHNGRMLQRIPSGKEKEYALVMEIKSMEGGKE